MDSYIMVNLIICLAAMFVCMCRMGAMQGSKTKKTIRYQYNVWFVIMFCSGFSFIAGEPATAMQTLLSLAVLSHLLIGFNVWRHGPPAYTEQPKEYRPGDTIRMRI